MHSLHAYLSILACTVLRMILHYVIRKMGGKWSALAIEHMEVIPGIDKAAAIFVREGFPHAKAMQGEFQKCLREMLQESLRTHQDVCRDFMGTTLTISRELDGTARSLSADWRASVYTISSQWDSTVRSLTMDALGTVVAVHGQWRMTIRDMNAQWLDLFHWHLHRFRSALVGHRRTATTSF
jgi:hypothetical protein